MHIHIHFSHNRDHPHANTGPFRRAAREVGATVDRLTGPALTERQRLERSRAEARNERYGGGIL